MHTPLRRVRLRRSHDVMEPTRWETRARSACARRFSRFRPDRELPNDVSVFKRVNDALKEGLDEEELLAKIDQFSAEASSASKQLCVEKEQLERQLEEHRKSMIQESDAEKRNYRDKFIRPLLPRKTEVSQKISALEAQLKGEA
jgi:hypothetical protein